MTTSDLHAVIMAGGSGTRFWPASRAGRPKQFLPLAHGVSLLQATVDRVRPLAGRDRTWIVTNAAQARALPEVLPDFPSARVIVEPEARDTAPCVALAAATVGSLHPDAVLVVMPADHLIEPAERFVALLRRGAQVAREHHMLVTFGITPTRPATAYGYIERGSPLDGAQPRASRVVRFREKPDEATARQFLAAGSFAWNSGIFVWTLPDLIAAMAAGSPALAAATKAMLAAKQQGDEPALRAAFASCPKTSVDFAVMEHAPRVAVVDSDVTWSDVGSFTSLGAVSAPDGAGNVSVLSDGAQVTLHDAKDCVVYGEGRRMIALFGVHDLVTVVVDDAVLVCPKDRADDLKKIVEKLRAGGHHDVL